MSKNVYPLLFTPVYKDYIWGGNKISRKFHRAGMPEICAESWEISDRPEGMSIVSNGPLAGTSLHNLVGNMGEKLIGTTAHTPLFPILIKIIDAKQRLSVQVHPDEQSACDLGGEAKTEMFYMLEAEPRSKIFAGLKPKTNRESFEKALSENRIEDFLHKIPAKQGKAIFVPSGCVHSIGKGCLLLEIEQNSNTTYRLYDWDRTDKNGKPRPLHTGQALRSIRWTGNPPRPICPKKLRDHKGNSYWGIITCPYFQVLKLKLTADEITDNDRKSFHILFSVSGKTKIEGNGFIEEINAGATCLLPAALDKYRLSPSKGCSELLRISLV